MMRLIWLVLPLTVLALDADTLRLRDGRQMEGVFVRGDTREVVFLPESGTQASFSLLEVESVTFRKSDVAQATAPRRRPPRSSGSAASAQASVVPAGTVLTVRMIDSVDSDATSAGEKFRASLDDPLVVDGKEVAARGADVTVQVVRVEQSGRFSGRDEVALNLLDITIGGKKYDVASQYAEVASNSRGSRTAKVVGGTAAVGAVIGAIAGGGKGAAIGATTGAGAGAAIQAMTRGERVKIPTESRLDFTLKQPFSVR